MDWNTLSASLTVIDNIIISYFQEHEKQLVAGAVAYINLDALIQGNAFKSVCVLHLFTLPVFHNISVYIDDSSIIWHKENRTFFAFNKADFFLFYGCDWGKNT